MWGKSGAKKGEMPSNSHLNKWLFHIFYHHFALGSHLHRAFCISHFCLPLWIISACRSKISNSPCLLWNNSVPLYRCKTLVFIIPSHCSSKSGLADWGSLAVLTENLVAVGHIQKMMYWRWMMEEKKSLLHLTHRELLGELISSPKPFFWICE